MYRISNHIYNWLGLYELWLIDHKADASKSFVNDLSQVLEDVNATLTSSQICGALQSEFGKVNTIAVIWQHQSFDHTKDLRQTWNEKGIPNRRRATPPNTIKYCHTKIKASNYILHFQVPIWWKILAVFKQRHLYPSRFLQCTK